MVLQMWLEDYRLYFFAWITSNNLVAQPPRAVSEKVFFLSDPHC